MVFTTAGSVEALMGFDFTDTTKPTTTQVTTVYIPMSDRKINRMNIPSLTDSDKSDLSAFWTCHLITLSKDVDFRTGDVSISSERIPTHFSSEFGQIVIDKGGRVGTTPLFKVANPSGR